jgi:hypothetical protein
MSYVSFLCYVGSYAFCFMVPIVHLFSFTYDVHYPEVLRLAGTLYRSYFCDSEFYQSLPELEFAWLGKCTCSADLGCAASAGLVTVSTSICNGNAGCDVTAMISSGSSTQHGKSDVCSWVHS